MTDSKNAARQDARKQAVKDMKREMILAAARKIFAQEGLEGASLRAIAQEAGYTPAALYFHFESKEAVYAALLEESLVRLQTHVDRAQHKASSPSDRFSAAAMGFFEFYHLNPKDLDLGFYLFRGGMTPKGVGKDRNQPLNDQLTTALAAITDTAVALGINQTQANQVTAEIFAHATGLLMLAHTGRMRMFNLSPVAMMERYVSERLDWILSSVKP